MKYDEDIAKIRTVDMASSMQSCFLGFVRLTESFLERKVMDMLVVVVVGGGGRTRPFYLGIGVTPYNLKARS